MCQYCKPPRDCDSTRRMGWINYACTRQAGHGGDHVACGTFAHAIKTWKRSKRETSEDSRS